MPVNDQVTIGGVSVSINSPCDVLRELRKAELIIATGESVAMTRFENDEVRFSAANASNLTALISRYEGLCAKSQGKSSQRARRVSWR